jgi:hypothetical protein
VLLQSPAKLIYKASLLEEEEEENNITTQEIKRNVK